MMTHPAGAGGAAHRAGAAASGSTNEAGCGLGVEFDGPATPAPAGAAAAPFSRALRALAAGGDVHPGARTGAAASDAAAVDPADIDVEADADESLAANSAAGTQEVSAPKGSVRPAGTWQLSSALAGSPTGAAAPIATEAATVNAADPTAGAGTSPGAGATGDAGTTQRGPRAPSARQSVARREARGEARNAARVVAAPKPGAAALPNDLLQALFAAQSALPAQSSTAAGAVTSAAGAHQDNSKHGDAQCDADDGAAAAPMPVPVTIPMQPQSADTGAATLAAVLQWRQTPRSDSNEHSATSTAPGAVEPRAADTPAAVGNAPDAAPASAPLWSTAIASAAAGATSAAPAAVEAPARPSASHGVVASVSVPPGKPVAARDAHSPGATIDAPLLSRGAADVAAGSLSMAAALRAASANNPLPSERAVAVPVHDRHWPAAVATQVLILSNDKLQAATLRLSPEHLGPVEVRIDMQDANVNVNFTAVHADTRAALEQALPELRAVLAGAGLTLGQATVQQQTRHESQIPNAPPRNGVAAAETTIDAPAARLRTLGIIDEYA
ncbi:MAG: flagellar hook-length control protein FliK [Proteobacteria bacterium]|nr:flagellar hook-length control protein FliK [Pseudomonadota bacterium]